jgi:hypothetical protein
MIFYFSFYYGWNMLLFFLSHDVKIWIKELIYEEEVNSKKMMNKLRDGKAWTNLAEQMEKFCSKTFLHSLKNHSIINWFAEFLAVIFKFKNTKNCTWKIVGSKNVISISPILIDWNPSKSYEKSLAISLHFPRFIFMCLKKMRKFIGSLGIHIIFLLVIFGIKSSIFIYFASCNLQCKKGNFRRS